MFLLRLAVLVTILCVAATAPQNDGETVEADLDSVLSNSLNNSLPADIVICPGKLDYNTFSNYIFYGSLLGSYYDEKVENCARRCYAHPYCESANHLDDGVSCELIAEEKVSKLTQYKYQSGCTYIEKIRCVTSEVADGCGSAEVESRLTTKDIFYTPNPALSFARLSEVRPASQPWAVSIQINKLHVCTAVLISPNYALTSAGCFSQSQSASRYQALLGAHSTVQFTAGQQSVGVAEIILHERFNPYRSRENDIALVRLAAQAKFSNTIKPACLPHHVQPGNPWACFALGWGRIGGYSQAVRLSELFTPFISRNQCNQPKWYNAQVSPAMLCGGHYHATSCQPDVGSPLLCSTFDNVWLVMGVWSWGEGCARKRKPAVYTNVLSHLRWIKQTTGINHH